MSDAMGFSQRGRHEKGRCAEAADERVGLAGQAHP